MKPADANDAPGIPPLPTGAGCLVTFLLVAGAILLAPGGCTAIVVTSSELSSGAPFHGWANVAFGLFFWLIPVCGAAMIWIAFKRLLR